MPIPQITFLQGDKPSAVWDPKENKPLFVFNRKKFKTNNPKIMGMLKKFGYERDMEAKEFIEKGSVSNITLESIKVDDEVSQISIDAKKAGKSKRIRLSRDLKEDGEK